MARFLYPAMHDGAEIAPSTRQHADATAGYFLVYPRREDVVFLDGSESRLKDYYMGKKVKPHRFCPECSSSVLIDFKNAEEDEQRPLLAMNVRLIVPSTEGPNSFIAVGMLTNAGESVQ